MRYILRWAAGLVAGSLVLTAVAYGVAQAALPGCPPATRIDALPAGVDAPPLWAPTVAQAPPGAVPIVVGGPSTAIGDILTGNESVVVFAGGAAGARTMDVPYIGTATPGETLLLSPDGTRVAYGELRGLGTVVQNLLDGKASLVPGTAEQGTSPIAWAPDGRTLLVVRYPEGSGGTVGTLDVATGVFGALLDAGDTSLLVGAYRPDGTLAVQAGDRLCVFAGGRQQSCFKPPAGARLAGKGAWTPDGRSLALVADNGRASDLTLVAPDTGTPTGAAAFRVDGVTTLRLLGWWPDGRAVMAAYRPEPDAPATFDPSTVDSLPTRFDFVHQISVLAVTGAGDTREISAMPGAFLSIDIADAALASGRTGQAVPAKPWPARPAMVAALTAVTTAAAVLLILLVLSVRARPTRRLARTPEE
ncbi:hypothetical protein [Dactylosporangium sp. NPDC048998]|uniref:hypothetical protein n=1 Tax=Dactylosporangium sp. NPDC048998 TaxID=3363976 RepID=UPI003710A390